MEVGGGDTANTSRRLQVNRRQRLVAGIQQRLQAVGKGIGEVEQVIDLFAGRPGQLWR